MDERCIREEICYWGNSLFMRGLSPGSSGNISVKLEDGFLFTPTNSCLGRLNPVELSKVDNDGNHISGLKATKELPLHFSCYKAQPDLKAIVHLHSTYAVALSCLECDDPHNTLPVFTPYFTMRLGALPLVPYYPPGDQRLGDTAYDFAKSHKALLLANHGPLVIAESLNKAVYLMEELEENAKLFFLLHDKNVRYLSDEQIHEIQQRYGK